jgi:phosphatidylglycerophosphate synthase
MMDAVLLVNHPALMPERLAGMTLIERQLFILSRAGFTKVWVTAHKPSDPRLASLRRPEGLELFWTSESAAVPVPPYLSLSADHLVRAEALREIASLHPPGNATYLDAKGRGVVQIVLCAGDLVPSFERRPMPEGSCVFLMTLQDKSPALPWLLKEATKSHDSFMARHFDRRLSMALTRRLLDTRVTPNQMTVFSTLVGLSGALLTTGGRASMTAGVLLVWAHTVLDGCDGEMARLRCEQSRIGGILDFWGDNVVHAALFLCLGIGITREGYPPIHLFLGLTAAIGALGAAFVVFLHSTSRQARGGPLFNGLEDMASGKASQAVRSIARIEDLLARRDFIYLLVFLVLIDYPEVFLWAAGIGTPMFLAALLYLRRAEGESSIPTALRRQPS